MQFSALAGFSLEVIHRSTRRSSHALSLGLSKARNVLLVAQLSHMSPAWSDTRKHHIAPAARLGLSTLHGSIAHLYILPPLPEIRSQHSPIIR